MQTLKNASSGNLAQTVTIAGVGDRILAFIIDGFILGCYCPIIVWLLLDSNLDDMWAWFVFLLGPLLFYNLIFEIVMKGQTPGKRAARIRVVTTENEAPSVGQYIIRWFFTIIGFYFISGVIALIVISANGKGQSFGDILAGTRVIKLSNLTNHRSSYSPKFPMVTRLDQYDIELAHRALYAERELDNPRPLTLVSERIKSELVIQTTLPNDEFLATVIKDYDYLSVK